MKVTELEQFSKALKDEGVQLKHFEVDNYMQTARIAKSINEQLKERAELVQSLISDYNKDFNDTVKSPEYKAAFKKAKNKEELTSEEKELLSARPAVEQQEGMVTGPVEFIEKLNKMRSEDVSLTGLNFVTNKEAFKAVVENASLDTQVILYERLFKH